MLGPLAELGAQRIVAAAEDRLYHHVLDLDTGSLRLLEVCMNLSMFSIIIIEMQPNGSSNSPCLVPDHVHLRLAHPVGLEQVVPQPLQTPLKIKWSILS